MLGRLHLSKKIRAYSTKISRLFGLALDHLTTFYDKRKHRHMLQSRLILLGITGLIIGGTLVAIFLIKGNKVAANWYNDNWLYRKSVTLPDHASEENDVYVTVTLDTASLISAGKLQTDCGDIRFVDQTGKLLDYYISSGCNTSETGIDVNMNTYPAGSVAIYMYYGNLLVENGTSPSGFSTSASNNAVTIDLQVSASGNDGDTQIAGDLDNSLTRSTLPIGSYNGNSQMFVTRFLSATVPQGATILSASYTITSEDTYNCGGCNLGLILYGEDADNATALTLTNMNNLTQTTANSGFWDWQNVSLDVEYSKDVTSIIQEIVDRGSWSSGNAINIIAKDSSSDYSEWQTAYAYDGSSSKAAKLSITYAAGASPTFGSEEIAPGPLGYWKFDEGYGTSVNDSSGNAYTGTLGTGSSAPMWRGEESCLSNSCLQFDGTDDYLSYGDVLDFEDGRDFTVTAWIKSNSFSTVQTVIAKKLGNSSGQVGYLINIGTSGTLNFYAADGSDQIWKGSSQALSTNTWYHIAFVFDEDNASNIAFYVNGVPTSGNLTGTLANVNSLANPQVLGIGVEPDRQYVFNGFIDEVKIYPYARTADEIKQDYLFAGAKGSSVVLGANTRSFLSDGLVGYWKMNETTGSTGPSWTTVDSSGNGNDGTGVGNVSQTTGKFGNAGSFDGTGDYITLGDPAALNPDNQMTVSLWVKLNSLVGYNSLISKRSDPTNQAGDYDLLTHDGLSDKFHFQIYNGSTWKAVTSTTIPTTGNWYHIVTTANESSGEMKMYVNGVLESTATETITLANTTSTAKIGDGAGDTNGIIDEVRVYNRVLSSAEVKSLYEWAPGPVVYYDFDEGTGTTIVNDKSGNGKSGTLHNFSNSSWKDGKYGKGLLFDGSSTYIGVTSPSLPTTDFTYSFWANFKDIAVSANHAVLDTGSNELTLLITDGEFDLHTNGSYRTYTPDTVSVGDWNYITLTRNGSTISIYINGKLENTATDSTAFNFGSCELLIGVDADSGCNASLNDYANYIMDEFKIYNYARTKDQILQDMNAGHPLVGTPVGSTVLHFSMDEGYDTTAHDKSPQQNNGTISGATWTNDGKFGKALSFDGNDSISISRNAAIQNTASEGTITVWVKYTILDGTLRTIADVANTGFDGLILFGSGSGNHPFLQYGIGGNVSTVHATSTFTTGQWYHVAVTWSATDAKIYINGKLEDTSTVDPAITISSGTMYLGSNQGFQRYFSGDMDEFKMYPVELTADQILIDMNQGKAMIFGSKSTGVGGTAPSFSAGREYCVPGDTTTCNGPVGEWKFDEGSGGSIFDTSVNENEGSLGTGSSAPTWKSGKFGKALQFDGSDVVSVPNDSSLIPGNSSWSVSVWAKPDNIDQTGAFLGKSQGSGSFEEYEMMITGHINASSDGKKLQVSYRENATNERRVISTDDVVDGGWHLYSFVADKDADTLSLYVDGRKIPTTGDIVSGSWPTIDNTPDLLIGRTQHVSAVREFNGYIDTLRIYNYARTPEQVAWEFNRGAPFAWYKFDECQGTTLYNAALNGDGKATGNNGTLTIGGSGENTVGTCSTSSTAWGSGSTGKVNSSVDLDGSDDYVTIDDADVFSFGDSTTDTPFSVSAWIKPSSLSTGGNDMIIAKRKEDVTNGSEWWFGESSTGKLNFTLGDSNTSTNRIGRITSSAVLSDNAWFHVIGTYDGSGSASGIKIYVNGIRVDDTNDTGGTYTAMNNSTAPVYIGSYLNSTGVRVDYFDGQIDDVRIFNYSLTADQVKQVYTNGAVSFK